MKKSVTVIVSVIVLTVAYWLVSPLFITREVSERLEDIPAPAVTGKTGGTETETETAAEAGNTVEALSSGTFRGVAGHSAVGTAKLLKSGATYYIRFEDDFRITNGPDLFVHFGKDGQYVNTAQLGALKGNVGGQNYEVPAHANPADFNEVWVWCRAFSVPFGVAALR